MSKLRILVSGMLAGDPYQGGATWAVLQYILGLRRLGHDVWFYEPTADSEYYRQVVEQFDLQIGIPDADLLLNISGMLTENIAKIPVRVYLDIDPAFNQL